MIIDCDACAVRDQECGDCVVSVLLGMPSVRGAAAGPAEALPAASGASRIDLELDRREQAAIAVLAAHGLVPPLRLVQTESGTDPVEEAHPRRAAG